MNTLRRIIHPEIRIDDSSKGICTYIASNESVDSYSEVIRADGWRFTNFVKNAPFVDSHNYSTIEKLVGKVIDFKVRGRALYETVQWSIDVAENKLAQLGWKMTEAGYCKAVSVGFYPVEYVQPGQPGWKEQLADLRIDDTAGVRTIYTAQEQVELSACILGANPDALACARSDGILTDAYLERIPELRRALEAGTRARVRSFSFSHRRNLTPKSPMSTATFLDKFKSITGLSPSIADDPAGDFSQSGSISAARIAGFGGLRCRALAAR